jgi:uncharacterized cupredoxin-like copper-binding protein
MSWRFSGVLAAAGVLVLAVACSGSGAGGREVQITQTDDGCSPGSVSVTPGEKLKLVIKNDSSHDPYEVEGIDGAKFEELNVPLGRTRSAGYTVPDSGGTHKLKCYVPGGTSTIIELTTGGVTPTDGAGATAASGDTPAAGSSTVQPPDTSVAVTLISFSIATDHKTVVPGAIRFVATNTSKTDVHELAVMRLETDGNLAKIGEVEGIAPEQAATLTVKLTPGTYQLACLIAAGESGSTVDHYQQGMHTEFKVE